MILRNSVKAAVAAAALTLAISGAQAQYSIVPPVASGSVTTLPYGGYYGPAIAPTPSINYGAPYFYQPMGFSFGNFGYDNNGYGYGYGYGPVGPGAFNNLGDVNNNAVAQSPGQTVNDTMVQGGIVDPTHPAADSALTGDADSAANTDTQNATRTTRAAAANLISVRRAPYNRIAISYNGNTAGVTSVSMMLLDSNRRVIQQQVLTQAPAQTLLRRPIGARYYRVILDYANGTERSITRPLAGR